VIIRYKKEQNMNLKWDGEHWIGYENWDGEHWAEDDPFDQIGHGIFTKKHKIGNSALERTPNEMLSYLREIFDIEYEFECGRPDLLGGWKNVSTGRYYSTKKDSKGKIAKLYVKTIESMEGDYFYVEFYFLQHNEQTLSQQLEFRTIRQDSVLIEPEIPRFNLEVFHDEVDFVSFRTTPDEYNGYKNYKYKFIDWLAADIGFKGQNKTHVYRIERNPWSNTKGHSLERQSQLWRHWGSWSYLGEQPHSEHAHTIKNWGEKYTIPVIDHRFYCTLCRKHFKPDDPELKYCTTRYNWDEGWRLIRNIEDHKEWGFRPDDIFSTKIKKVKHNKPPEKGSY